MISEPCAMTHIQSPAPWAAQGTQLTGRPPIAGGWTRSAAHRSGKMDKALVLAPFSLGITGNHWDGLHIRRGAGPEADLHVSRFNISAMRTPCPSAILLCSWQPSMLKGEVCLKSVGPPQNPLAYHDIS